MKSKADVMKDLAKVTRRTIKIQKATIDQGKITDWTDWKTLKAEKTQLYGTEYYAAATVGQEQTIVFTVRFLPALEQVTTTDYRLVHEDKTYDIKQVDHLPGGLWTKIKAIQRPRRD